MNTRSVRRAAVTWATFAALLPLGASVALAASNVSLVSGTYHKPGPGDDVVISVVVNPADGVKSMALAFSYDAAALSPTGVYRTGFSDGFSVTSNLATPGVVELNLEGTNALEGSGAVAWVSFHVAAGAGTALPFSWVSASLNGGAVPAQTKGLTVTVSSATATIGIPHDLYGATGSQISVPISVQSLGGGSAFDFAVEYDPAVLTASSVQKSSFASCMSLASNVSVSGVVYVSLYGICSLTGTGPLVQITFNVVGPLGTRTPLVLATASVEENHVVTAIDDGLFNACGSKDADGDGYSVCAGDCNDASAAAHPGAVETCDGLDDDCNESVDDVAVPGAILAVAVGKEGGDAVVSWTALPGMTGYDVVGGSLEALRATGGDFSLATDRCLLDDASASKATDAASQLESGSVWYLVRPVNCTVGGFYEDGSMSQLAPRDPGIAASPSACP
jgi:hypothetical protein